MKLNKEKKRKRAKETLRRFRKKHPEKAVEYNQHYDEKYPGRRAELAKNYRERHPERIRKACSKYYKLHREQIESKRKSFRKNNPIRTRAYNLKSYYGLTLADYDIILKKQKGTCAICHKKAKSKSSLCVDHDHNTQIVRGLLCPKCNLGLGLLHNITILKKALKYLQVNSNRN